MAGCKNRTPMATELIDELMVLTEINNRKHSNPIQASVVMDGSLLQIKRFFRAHYLNKECMEPTNMKDKISFWNKFVHYILENEIGDKPEYMSEEKFLFNVKFEEYSTAVIEKMILNWRMH